MVLVIKNTILNYPLGRLRHFKDLVPGGYGKYNLKKPSVCRLNPFIGSHREYYNIVARSMFHFYLLGVAPFS
jgi:hypothetical protein